VNKVNTGVEEQCQMENLVKKEGMFAERIAKYKENWYTRVEAGDLLKSCQTYECSFEHMWKERAQCINSMVAVYFPAKKLFTYCHWWNSTTSKKYGQLQLESFHCYWPIIPSMIDQSTTLR